VLALTATPGHVAAAPAASPRPSHRPRHAFNDQRLVVGTYNIRANRSVKQCKKGVTDLRPEAQVAGLQEVAGSVALKKPRFLQRGSLRR
jgi:hypothetical protein